jgi:hypothetical protein
MTGTPERWLPSLRRALAQPADAAGPASCRCEFCGEPLPAEHAPGERMSGERMSGERMSSPATGVGHGHVVDVENRSIRCACQACRLLFAQAGAGGGRLRAVGDRRAYDERFPLDGSRWAALEIPVGLAFLVEDSHAGRLALFYPSPAGATESTVAPDRVAGTWRAALADAPAFPGPQADIEAVLLYRPQDGPVDWCEAFLLPVDACYGLIGRIRRSWSGFAGGSAVAAEIAEFLADARRRSRPAGARRAVQAGDTGRVPQEVS